MTAHCFQYLESYIDLGSGEVFPPVEEPLEGADEEDNAKCNYTVV